MLAYLWNCSLKNKVSHIGLCWVGSMDGDDCDVGIGISSLKGEVDFEAILVICCHRRNTYDNLNKKKDCFSFQLHDGPQEHTPTIQSVQIQSSRAAIQPGFLSYQVDNVFTWDLNLLGENVFSLVRQKSLLRVWPLEDWTPLNQTLTSCDIIKQGLWGDAIQEERRLGARHSWGSSRGGAT